MGAFGAHALESLVSANRLATWDTAVQYHFVHALALLAIGLWSRAAKGRFLKVAMGSFVLGILIFSGSLYLLVITDTGWLGAVTPIGGTAFIVGWIAMAVSAFQLEEESL